MRTFDQYLDEAKKETGSDRQTGLRVGMSAAHMSIARKKGQIGNEYCAKIAEIIHVDPLEVIAAAEVKKHPEKRHFWAKWIAATVIMSVGIIAQNTDFKSDLTVDASYPAIYYAHCAQLAVVLILAVFFGKKWSNSLR